MRVVEIPPASSKFIIVCPLQFERSLLLRCGVGAWADIHCCGPGPDAAGNWVRSLGNPAPAMLLLVGVAGGLSSRAKPGKAFFVDEVQAITGKTTASALQTSFGRPAGAAQTSAGADLLITVCSVENTIHTPDEKKMLRERADADLVDMESFAFAQAAESRGFQWAIVRGVSDGPDDHLPMELRNCVDAQGRTRVGTVLWNILKRPGLLNDMLRLRRASVQSMREAAAMLRDLYYSSAGP